MENKIKSFEDLFIWQESLQLCFDIYDSLSGCKEFSLRDQIQKSSVSVPSNIAEGFERETDKEFIRFLYFARGSSGELRTQLYIAKHLKIIDEETCLSFIDKTKRNASMIYNLIKVKKGKLKNGEVL
ncbi:MAG TPA: four helix bundle protein [Chitinophagaceae bacterium]|nr:four helix bundle protein [Chitinophagaceae bacterium]